jgi:hypothetical protein
MALAFAPPARSQEASVAGALVEGLTGGAVTTLTGYALTAIGLNSQASVQSNILNQLSEINDELDTISSQLTDIENAIETQTCVDSLSSSSVTDALTSIATISNTYSDLLQAEENTSGSVTPAEIEDFLDQVENGPGGDLPSISAALVTINIALQSTDNEGIIGICEKAVTSTPATGSFGADLTFYSDPINLLQYFADYQTVAGLLLVEYYHYEAFLSSPFYSATVITNGLPASEAGQVCQNPTGETLTQCAFARDALEQVYVYLQNQYSADGVPYSTDDSNGNLQTGLYLAGNNTNYLFAASLEEFTNFEDIPQNNCSSPLTSSDPCGLTYRNDPSTSPFWTDLYDSTYQYETGWAPATAKMWRAVLDAWADGSSHNTVADGLTTLGFQNAADKIILTPTEYNAIPTLDTGFGVPEEVFTSSGLGAVCFLDTNQERSLAVQPWCYNGSSDGVSYGDSTSLVSLTSKGYVIYNDSECDQVISNTDLESATNQPCFYGFSSCDFAEYTSNSNYEDNTGSSNKCPDPGFWQNGVQPSWLLQTDGTVSLGGYFWPAIDVSSPTCGTNLSFGLLQPAVARSATNFLGIPTMCGTDFDNYFAGVQPRNPYQQIAFTTSPVSGAGGSSASLGPITIQLQDTSTGSTLPITVTFATTVDLSSTSSTGVFALTQNGSAVTSVTIPSGSSTVTFYYGDSTGGTPQITADPGNVVPGVQTETITSGTDASANVVGTTQNVGSGKPNGRIRIRGTFTAPKGIQLQQSLLTFSKVLSEDSGAGELVRQANAASLHLPLSLVAIRGSTADDAVYRTKRGATPRVHLEIFRQNRKNGRSKFDIEVDRTQITSPSQCSGKPPTTKLHTQMVANDGTHPSAVVDVDIDWECHRNGRLTTPPR